jgi:hypothetical protein
MTRSLAAVVVLLCAPVCPVWAQDMVTRRMEFRTGTPQAQLAVEVEYQDPSGLDLRLRGSRLLPVSFAVRNVSSETVAFEPADLRLNLNGDRALEPVSEDAVVAEIESLGARASYPPLLRRVLPVLGRQSEAFHPGIYAQFRARVRSVRLPGGVLRRGESRKGYVFFMRPADVTSFNSVMWLEWRGPAPNEPQLLETKSIRVRTRVSEQATFRARLEQLWNEVVHGIKPPFNRSYALLIGIGKYKYLRELSSPAQDVRKMELFLEAQGFNEIVTVEDETVTLEGVRLPQKYFSAKIQNDDRFLFYYSGHGLSVLEGGRERGYLPLVSETKNSHKNSIPMDSLVAWMRGLNSRHLLVIIDSCFSGLAIEGPDVEAGARARRGVPELSELAGGPARYLLMAGTAGQESYGGDTWKGSLFTDTLIRGLKRDANIQRDRIVTTRELYVWLRDAVTMEAQRSNRVLTPLMKDLGPNGVSAGDFFFVM